MKNDVWIKQRIKELEPKIIEMRRYLHQHPEPGFQEYNTAKFVSETLTGLGLEVKTGIAKTGVTAILRGNKPGKTVALRADMDALTITEKTGLPFASVNPGVMHACGHDAHTSAMLGTAMVLSELREELTGSVKFIFQPAEEGPGGAKPMIEEGVLEGVDAIVGAHVWQQYPVGKVAVRYGEAMACLDSIDISILGKGCHGAAPHQGVDAIAVAALVVSALQTIASREVNPVKPVVVTVGTISGGYAYNIIADEVAMKGTVRALDAALRQSMPERIERVIRGVTEGMRADYTFSYHFGYPPTVNNDEITARVEKTLTRVFGAERMIRVPEPSMGGEDMAYYLEKIPGTYFFVGSSNPEKGIDSPGHKSTFDIDEEAITIMTEAMVCSAIDLLGQ
ncbi:MAG: M20 family metallopeptidase [Negativicutes bacterium]